MRRTLEIGHHVVRRITAVGLAAMVAVTCLLASPAPASAEEGPPSGAQAPPGGWKDLPDGTKTAAGGGVNDFGCKPSEAQPRPIVLLHGTFATYYEDLNFLQADLALRGYCTFSLTYGDYEQFPLVGGLKPVAESNLEIKDFVAKVRSETGAGKVDVVGHSQGGLQALYLAKFQNIQDQLGRIVAIAPPTNGISLIGLRTLAERYLPGGAAELHRILQELGVGALSDQMPDGEAVTKLNDGPVAQAGIDYTIIMSRNDTIVPPDSSVVDEDGVANQYVQDSCPFDPVGHIGEAYDLNVWHLVRNALDPTSATPIKLCAVGAPT